MLKGEMIAWRRSVFAFIWAEVEFLRQRHRETVREACQRIAARDVGYTMDGNRKPWGPLYSVKWNDGSRTDHYRRGLRWVYEALLDKGAVHNSDNLQNLYYTARRKRRSDIRLKRDSDFLLEALRNGRLGGYLRASLTPTEKRGAK